MLRRWGLPVFLFALTLVVYLQVARFGFVRLDDPSYVLRNPHVLGGLKLSGVRWAFSTFHDGNWIPLTWLSLTLDASFYGKWPGGYHITNVLFHAVNVLIVYWTFASMTGNVSRSAFVAALFAVHPLHVESVAWIAERKDVLSLLFGLLSLRAYVKYAHRQRIAWLGLAWAYFLASLLSKQTLVTLPVVLLLLDYWPLGRYTDHPDVAPNSGGGGPGREPVTPPRRRVFQRAWCWRNSRSLRPARRFAPSPFRLNRTANSSNR